MMRGDGWNVLILSFCCICCRYFAIVAINCFALSGSPGRVNPIYFRLDNRHGWVSPTLDSRHVHHKDPIPVPAAKVHDPSIVATLPALPAY